MSQYKHNGLVFPDLFPTLLLLHSKYIVLLEQGLNQEFSKGGHAIAKC